MAQGQSTCEIPSFTPGMTYARVILFSLLLLKQILGGGGDAQGNGAMTCPMWSVLSLCVSSAHLTKELLAETDPPALWQRRSPVRAAFMSGAEVHPLEAVLEQKHSSRETCLLKLQHVVTKQVFPVPIRFLSSDLKLMGIHSTHTSAKHRA